MLGVEKSDHWVTPAREKGAVEEWSRMGSEREGASPGEPEFQAQWSAIHSHEVEVSCVSNRLISLTHIPFISASSCSIPMSVGHRHFFTCCCPRQVVTLPYSCTQARLDISVCLGWFDGFCCFCLLGVWFRFYFSVLAQYASISIQMNNLFLLLVEILANGQSTAHKNTNCTPHMAQCAYSGYQPIAAILSV